LTAGRPKKAITYDTNIRVSRLQIKQLKRLKQDGEVYGDVINKLLQIYNGSASLKEKMIRDFEVAERKIKEF